MRVGESAGAGTITGLPVPAPQTNFDGSHLVERRNHDRINHQQNSEKHRGRRSRAGYDGLRGRMRSVRSHAERRGVFVERFQLHQDHRAHAGSDQEVRRAQGCRVLRQGTVRLRRQGRQVRRLRHRLRRASRQGPGREGQVHLRRSGRPRGCAHLQQGRHHPRQLHRHRRAQGEGRLRQAVHEGRVGRRLSGERRDHRREPAQGQDPDHRQGHDGGILLREELPGGQAAEVRPVRRRLQRAA